MTDKAEYEVLLTAVADVLIPPGHDGPAAGEVGIAALVEQVLDSRGDIKPAFLALVNSAVSEDPEGWARALLTDRPTEFTLLTDVIVAAWLTAPEARRWLEWRPITGEFTEPHPLDESQIEFLLAPVRERGQTYRPTDWRPETVEEP